MVRKKPTRKGKERGKTHTNRRINHKERGGAGRTFRGDGLGREVGFTDQGRRWRNRKNREGASRTAKRHERSPRQVVGLGNREGGGVHGPRRGEIERTQAERRSRMKGAHGRLE